MSITFDQTKWDEFLLNLQVHLSDKLSSIDLYKTYQLVEQLQDGTKPFEPNVIFTGTIRSRFCINGLWSIKFKNQMLTMSSNKLTVTAGCIQEVFKIIDISQFEDITFKVKQGAKADILPVQS